MNNRPIVSLAATTAPTTIPASEPTTGNVPGVSFAINTGTGPTGIDTGEIGGGPGDPPPPVDIDRMTYTIAEDDPNGQWSVTITNTGSQDGVFRILIVPSGRTEDTQDFHHPDLAGQTHVAKGCTTGRPDLAH